MSVVTTAVHEDDSRPSTIRARLWARPGGRAALIVVALLILVPAGLLTVPTLPLTISVGAAFAALVVPFFLMQYAIQRLAPVLVTAALALIPAIALFVEMAAGRTVTWPTVLLGLLIVPASLAVFATEQRQH